MKSLPPAETDGPCRMVGQHAETASMRAEPPPFGARRLEFMLHGLQSPINIGMILRVAETYRFHVSIVDSHHVLADPAKFGTIADFACGAVERRGFERLDSERVLARRHRGGRLVTTSTQRGNCSLPAFCFDAGDVIVLGNEYDGLPDHLMANSDAVLHVPMPPGWTPKPKARRPIDPARTAPVARDGSPNLNVAMTAAIICYAAYAAWLDGHRAHRLENDVRVD